MLRTEPAVAARSLHKRFVVKASKQVVRALDGVSLEVPAGTLTALVGPDGAGKTTLLRLAAGLMRADQGQLQVLGIDVAADAQAVQDRISYMPQRFGLYEDLSVQENLDLYADLHGVAKDVRRERYARLMTMTDLGRFTTRPAGKLSGGMKQKLGLACTLVRSPELLLLDEPTVGVDPLSRRESGSTPTVGSSSSSSCGERTSVQARPSFCFMPPESLPAGRSVKRPRSVISISRA